MAIMNMGTELVRIEGGEEEVLNVFRGRRKVVALLSAIGDAGRTVLESVGFDMDHGTYERAMQILAEHYGIEDNIFVKTAKILNARQRRERMRLIIC